MDKTDQIVSDLMMPIKKELNDAYYYGRHPEQSRKVLDELETRLESQLTMQYLYGWRDGRNELLDELKKKVVGGHK